jgi:hypothetical protein
MCLNSLVLSYSRILDCVCVTFSALFHFGATFIPQKFKLNPRPENGVSHNNIVFHNKLMSSLMQFIFRNTYWYKFWNLLQKEEMREDIRKACQFIEVVAMELFTSNGWIFNARIHTN